MPEPTRAELKKRLAETTDYAEALELEVASVKDELLVTQRAVIQYQRWYIATLENQAESSRHEE